VGDVTTKWYFICLYPSFWWLLYSASFFWATWKLSHSLVALFMCGWLHWRVRL